MVVNISAVKKYTGISIRTAAFKVLFLLLLVYNYHRYILKYGHEEFVKGDYQPTPFVWKVGKYILVAACLLIIYTQSRFTLRVNKKIIALYILIIILLIINLLSGLLYSVFSTDELEYLMFTIMLLPMTLVDGSQLKADIKLNESFLSVAHYIVIGSNWIVIANYFLFDRIPFHSYESVMIRFGSLWDDPNPFSIFNVFLMAYAIFNKRYFIAFLHFANVLLAISLNGYILLIVVAGYFLLNNRLWLINSIWLVLLFVAMLWLAYINLDLLKAFYELKQGSIEGHAASDFSFQWLPLLQPLIMHETWLLSFTVNYFPISVPIVGGLFWFFLQCFFFLPKSSQRLYYILFFVTSCFLPFLYMFPINVIGIYWMVLYIKQVRF